MNQRDLADFLDRHGLDYLVPTTGVGPNGSILGNALDGGYGLTPIADHFDALSSNSGYWGNGQPFGHTLTMLVVPTWPGDGHQEPVRPFRACCAKATLGWSPKGQYVSLAVQSPRGC